MDGGACADVGTADEAFVTTTVTGCLRNEEGV